MAKFKIQKDAETNVFANPGNVIGGTGGLTSISGTQVQPVVFIEGASKASGSILRARGRNKFLVSDGTNTGVCTLTNVPSANVGSGQMSVQINTARVTSANLITFTGSATTFAYLTYSTGNVAGDTIVAGERITGTAVNGNVTISSISTVGSLANANLSFSSQVIANATVNVNASVFASRLTNKFVTDFDNNKYVWSFGLPSGAVVQINGN